jgi:hypothetical protein
MVEAVEVMRRVKGLVLSETVVMAKSMMEAFSMNSWPNVVSHLSSFTLLCRRLLVN